MNCPLCMETALDARFHDGIEVDVCPRCKGIWLDRGELDRLLGTHTDRHPARPDLPPPVGLTVPDQAPPRPDLTPNKPKKSKGSKKKGKKKKSKGQRLADLLDDVLDL